MSQEEIRQLLSKAGSAHHTYEQTELNGVYDEEWPAWYASHLIDHGLNDLLSQSVAVDRLAQFLSDSNEQYEATDKHFGWAEYTAAAITKQFS